MAHGQKGYIDLSAKAARAAGSSQRQPGAAEREENHPRKGVSVGCGEAAETAKEGCFHRL